MSGGEQGEQDARSVRERGRGERRVAVGRYIGSNARCEGENRAGRGREGERGRRGHISRA